MALSRSANGALAGTDLLEAAGFEVLEDDRVPEDVEVEEWVDFRCEEDLDDVVFA
jgi:hypothetical protein